jgi:tetratricopeptide (TPR) repeat protein
MLVCLYLWVVIQQIKFRITDGGIVNRLFGFGFILLFFFSAFKSNGKEPVYVYDYNEHCDRAYQYCMSMRFADAHAALIQEIKANPYNLMITYVADYEDCITLLLNSDRAELESRKSQMERRLELLEKGDQSSPWYRLCKSGVYLHWAIIHMRFGEEIKAAIKFRKSFSLLQENEHLFPAFEYNQVFSGLREAVVGSLPGSYKWLASIFGMTGNVINGTNRLAGFVNKHNEHHPLYAETVLYHLFTRFYLGDEREKVWNFINSPQFQTQNNLLHTFVKSTIALDYGKSITALQTLQAASACSDNNKFPVFDYLAGVALLTNSDTACISYFRRYLARNKSTNYIKDCWQKMANAYYIADDMVNAAHCRKQITANGIARLDADRQAENFGESSAWPIKKLLEARLLSDGGNYNRALQLLNSIELAALVNPADRSEYLYRTGRVYEALGDSKKALESYQLAINTGSKRHEQYASRAALQMGRIYEYAGMRSKAMSRYKECMSMPGHDFQNSIDHQAKSGMNRIEGG